MDGNNDAALSPDGAKTRFFGDQCRERRMVMKILMVDDEKDIVDLISVNLEREGFKVIPAYSGEEALELVRAKNPDLMILDLMLPGVQGLEVCRQVRAALRRTGWQRSRDAKEGKFSHKGLLVDFDKYEVMVAGKRVNLSPIEMKLLSFFTKNPGRVYTRDQLLHKVWGDAFVTPRSVDVHVSHLRKLIEKDAQKPCYILTVTGVGYKFDDSE